MATENNGGSNGWRFNKEISFSNLIVLVAYGATSVWFMSDSNARQIQSERQLDRLVEVIDQIEDANRITSDRLTRMEVLVDVMSDQLDAIDKKIPETGP